jgi:hypothetical protein
MPEAAIIAPGPSWEKYFPIIIEAFISLAAKISVSG